LGFGFFNIVMDEKKQSWHDILAKTKVVSTEHIEIFVESVKKKMNKDP
jgi:hypothetical protein